MHNRLICVLILGIFLPHFCHAQSTLNQQIDSLKTLLPARENDSIKADLYNQISWIYRNVNIDSSMAHAERGYAISKIIGYKKGINLSLNYLGIGHRNHGNYTKALELFLEALRASEETNDLTQKGYTLINIGNIYLYQMNLSGALEYFENALETAKIIGNKDMQAYCHLNIGRAYARNDNLFQAEQYLKETKRIRTELNDFEGLAIANVDLAEIYIKKGQRDEALKLLMSNLENVELLDHKSTLTYSYINVCRVLIDQGKLNQAQKYAEKTLDLTRKYGLKNNEFKILDLLSEIAEKKGNYREALDSYRSYSTLRDSIFSEENVRKIESLHAQYAAEKKAVETEYLKDTLELNELVIKRQRLVILLSGVIIVLLMFLAIIFFWSSRERKKLNHQIQKQKEAAFRHNNDLIDINRDKNNFIRILSHDLRAPINNIKGLTEVHQLDGDKEFSDDQNRLLNLIKSESDRMLNMISKILNTESLDSKESTMKSEKVNLVTILDVAMQSFGEVAKLKNIQLVKNYLSQPHYVIGDSIHLHQVVENLISNALKFTQSGRKIYLELEDTIETIRMIVKDQGPGLTEEDKTKIFKKFQTLSAKPTGNEESSGLGLSIVKRYVEEMNGKIWYESELGRGTSFIVEFDRATEEKKVKKV